MLRNARELERFELRARDGKLGHVDDFFFDDQKWIVRYLVVDTGTWLNSRKVLIAPAAVSRTDWEQRVLPLNLTQEQVRNSPSIDTEQPVSREHEAALTQYYNWPAYWGVAGFPDVGFGLPVVPPLPIDLAVASAAEAARRSPAAHGVSGVEDHHVRSVRTVTGHAIEATDGEIGHVDDFLIDDRSWNIGYLVVDTRNWLPGKKVIVAPQWIHAVGWDEAKVFVDLTRDAIRTSPAYDPQRLMTPDYAARLHLHYDRLPPPPF